MQKMTTPQEGMNHTRSTSEIRTTGVHEDDNVEGSGRRRFEQSYSRYMAQLRAQRQVNQLFQIKREREDPGDFEMEVRSFHPVIIVIILNTSIDTYSTGV